MPSKKQRDWKIRINDILECIARIQKYTKGMGFDEFESDDKTIDSVLRNLEIIGEASRHVPREVKSKHHDLPWAEMNTMRNIVIHEYHGVNLNIIWQTITQDLPPIVPNLKKILEENKQK
jgi:uncharacterized protein with HEPN domain